MWKLSSIGMKFQLKLYANWIELNSNSTKSNSNSMEEKCDGNG
jgi:hypothetical protein